jgi:hypothetical protein
MTTIAITLTALLVAAELALVLLLVWVAAVGVALDRRPA